MLGELFTQRRLRRYPLAVLAGAAAGFTLFLATSNGLRAAGGGRVGGDFPGFYGAARIIREGTPRRLYDPAVQQRAQADLLPDADEGWVRFAYPPFVAVAYVPFTFLTFKTAYVLYTLLMAACCGGAIWMLRPHLPFVDRYFAPCVAATLTFYPLYRAILGGQNTALSLLCAAGAAAAIARNRDVVAGLWMGAWLFKPQLALPVAILIAIGGHPRVTLGVAIAALSWYLVAAFVAGPTWPLWWWRDGVVPFVVADRIVDKGNGVSFIDVATDLGAPALGWLAILVVGCFALKTAWRSDARPAALVGSGSAAAVLMAPRALYYDGGLAILGLVAAGDALGRRSLPYVSGAWLLAAAQPLRDYLPVPPVTVVVVGAFVLALKASAKAAVRKPGGPVDGDRDE